MRRLDKDVAALLALAGLQVLKWLPDWSRGLGVYWGDLTYIHLPWRTYDAQLLQAGRLPLWNPHLYGGMPQAAGMQDSLFYPGSAPHWLFGFATATAVFDAFHYWLAGALMYLALRSCGARRAAAFGGAALCMLGGVLLAREGFLNHLAVLSLAPALLLFFGRPLALSAVLATAFLAGYPPFLVGAAAAAWAVALAAGAADARRAKLWLAAGLGAAALGACLLLPAWELVGLSRRSAGVEAGEALIWAFRPRDLALWLSPRLVPGFSAAVDWTRSCHVGFVGALCAALGLAALPRRRAAVLAGWLLVVTALLLAGSNAVSTALWKAVPGLSFVRYPGNLAYLAVLPLSVLAAAGLSASRLRLRLAAALCAELLFLSWGAQPRAARDVLASPGPLARRLQTELDGHRYLMSPRALESASGKDVLDWRHRLYGLTNAPARLRSLGNFGEPLVPRTSYALMDHLYSAGSPADAVQAMRWSDVAVLLSPEPAKGPGFSAQKSSLWSVTRVGGAAGARLLKEPPPAELARWPADAGRPLAVARPREDAYGARGEGAGWLFVAEPLYPGWKVWLETPRGPGAVRPVAALGPFQAVSVPPGPWEARWRYEPGSFAAGLALTALAAYALMSAAAGRLERALA